MTGEQIIKHYGGTMHAAAALDVTKQCIINWSKKPIPMWSQHAIHSISGYALKVDKTKRGVK